MKHVASIYKEWYQQVMKQLTVTNPTHSEASFYGEDSFDSINIVKFGNNTTHNNRPTGKASSAQMLQEWLNKQPFETVKVLQTLLYIGRDEDLRNGTTAQGVYTNQRTLLDKNGWNTLDVEVRQITGKTDAVQQIIRGYTYLCSLP